MTTIRLTALVALAAILGACGANPDITCDEVQYYQTAELSKRVEAPEGLDQLDPNREMPMPEAAPRPPREAGSPCFDRPPRIRLEE